MRTPNYTTVTCPRCTAIVSGDYRFCPECACRLRSQDVHLTVPVRSPSWPYVLVLLGALMLITGFVLAGIALFRKAPTPAAQAPTPTAVDPAPTRRELGIQEIESSLVRIDAGVSRYRWERDPETGEGVYDASGEPIYWQVYVNDFYMMRYEVTSAQYAEFLTALEDAGSTQALFATLPDFQRFYRDLHDPVGSLVQSGRLTRRHGGGWTGSVLQWPEHAATVAQYVTYAEIYVDRWWDAWREAQGPDAPTERPRALSLPLTGRWQILLQTPPSWVTFREDGTWTWDLPDAQRTLPVTGVSLVDARAFARWVSQRLSLALRLPLDDEWVLAFQGGSVPTDEDLAPRRFPWGNEARYWLCNSHNLWLGDVSQAKLLDVTTTMGGGLETGATVQGLLNMAGNAREWTLPQTYSLFEGRSGDRTYKSWLLGHDTNTHTVQSRGGSYLMGIEECTRDFVVTEDLRTRHLDLGFRLVSPAGPVGR